jgi:2-phospho-L-lactate guanylyltransferase (CobY/MobA/RfbA family)
MATAPTSRKLNLTRDQLASFLSDQQQIRQFELLFATVDQIAPDVVNEINISAGTAQATANEALAQIVALAQDTAVDDAVLNAKVQQALDSIPRLATALELLALAPVRNNIELGHDVNGLLPVKNGGTNATATPTAGGVAYGTGTAYAITAAGTAGQILISNAASAPTWSSAFNATAVSTASVASPLAWDSSAYAQYALTALANALTINADANAAPVDGQKMTFRIKDNGTARALT